MRDGNERAFAALVSQYHAGLVRAASRFVRDTAAAQDVVQETWIGLLGSLERFEGRCSLKSWIFTILYNKAKTRATRDGRSVSLSSQAAEELASDCAAVDPRHFRSAHETTDVGHWKTPPAAWHTGPERTLGDAEALRLVRRAIDDLPPAQGTVMLLRDVHALTAESVCCALDISPANQRVLLHRARARVRSALADLIGDVV